VDTYSIAVLQIAPCTDGHFGRKRSAIAIPDEETKENEVSVQNLCFLPKAWAPYFLAPLSPWQALQTFNKLLETTPSVHKAGFEFVGTWLSIASTHDADATDAILKAKWQNPPAEQKMITWMQKRTLFVNDMPATAMASPGFLLDLQECFNKALETVAALRPVSEAAATKKYTPAELQRLRAACSLLLLEMEMALPIFHEQLLTEGHTKKGTELVLAQALQPRGAARIHVSSAHITLAVRESIVLAGLLNSGYNPTCISAHSLRASGAMALQLNDVGEDHIKKIGFLVKLHLAYLQSRSDLFP
jgi:hypothetical protein